MTTTDTRVEAWRVEAGEREQRSFPVLDEEDEQVNVAGWTVDAVIKTYPGGDVLHTFPAENIEIATTGTVTLTIPAPVSAAWTFLSGWYRVVITAPTGTLTDPDSYRILQGPLIVDPD